MGEAEDARGGRFVEVGMDEKSAQAGVPVPRVPKWEGWEYTPVFFQRVRKRFGINEVQIFQFWECARDLFCWGCGGGQREDLRDVFE